MVDDKETWWDGDCGFTTKPTFAAVYTREELFGNPLPTEEVSLVIERDDKGRNVSEYVPLLGGDRHTKVFEKQP
jgi:hypothetical protein